MMDMFYLMYLPIELILNCDLSFPLYELVFFPG